MINLLSDDSKRDLRAARSNTSLVNYVLVLILGIVFLGLVCFGVYMILMNTQANAERIISENSSKDTSQGALQAQNTALRQSLTAAKAVLDNEVIYSKFITNLASLMPAGVVLDNLSLSPATFDAPTSLQFYAKSTEDALALKERLEASAYFSGISFQSLTSSTAEDSPEYPVSATIALTINKSIAQ